MLDIFETFLNMHHFSYLRMDGSTSLPQRQKMMEKFNTDMVGVSYLVSVMAIGKIVFLAVSGVLSDKFGRKPFVFLGIASYIVFFLGIYFARSFSIAVFFALFAGAGNSFLDTGSMPAWIEAYPKAGGTVTTLADTPLDVLHPSSVFATNAKCHGVLKELAL